MGWSELYACAQRHHGAFAVRWAPSVGLTPRAVQARADRERWAQPYRGVVLVPGATWDHHTTVAAAQAALHADAAASGLSAAWLHGLSPRPPALPHLLIPHRQRVRAPVGVLRRSRHMTSEDCTVVDGIVTLHPNFWLVSIAGNARTDDLLAFAIDGRQRGLIDMDGVAARVETMPRVRGRAKVLYVVQRLAVDGSDSQFESRVRERLRSAGLAPSAAPVAVTTQSGRAVHLDIAFVRERVAIECVGFIAHSTRTQLNRDARRENEIALCDEWLVLKLTWDRFMHDWDGFLRQLVAALARRRV